MTRLPLLVGVCLLVTAVAGAGVVPDSGLSAGPEHAAAPGAAGDSGVFVEPSEVGTETSESGAETSEADTESHEISTAPEISECEDCLLVVENATTGERLLTRPVSEGTTVALNYTHSVEKTPVLDVYEVNGTELEMVRMEFQSYGAGLPARADVTVTENDTFVFDPEGSYDHLYVTPGHVAGHELIVGDRTYDLVERSNASTVKIYVTRQSAVTTSTEKR